MDDTSGARDASRVPGFVMYPLLDTFAQIDIYLFDQLLRGNILPEHRILDAGCGGGRNLVYLLQAGFDVSAADADAAAVEATGALAGRLGRPLGPDRLRHEPIEALSFPDGAFDVVIASAVLHFARDHAHFDRLVDGLWRVVAPGGLLFARLASTVAFESAVTPLGGGRVILPDQSERYVVDEARLVATTARIGGRLDDPLKTTVVQAQRSMTTWVVRRPPTVR